MKTNYYLTIGLILLTFFSCKSDDDSNQSEYPKTVNIKFEVVSDASLGGDFTTVIDNDSQDHFSGFPFSFSSTQQEVNIGTYLKLIYSQNISPFDEHNAELRILVNNELVVSETFFITEDNNSGFIEYTFQ